MKSRRAFAKVGAVVAGASVAALLGAVPATADEAKGRIDSDKNDVGHRVNIADGRDNMKTTLFSLKLDGGNSFRAYCVEISVEVDPGRPLLESPWDEFPNPDSPFHANRDQINWVLHHGYPAADLDALEKTLTEAGAELHNGLDEKEAIAGTQAAVWHFSDNKNLNREDPTKADANADADVLALYDYLTGEDNTGIGAQPTPALEVAPETVSGKAGERLGPFTIATTGKITDLTSDLPEGVTITDADGNELAPADITDGTEIYIDVPADAAESKGGFEVTASAHLDTGRLFVSEGYQRKPAQSLIVAQSEKTTLSAGAKVDWQAVPETTQPEETTSTPTTTAPSTTSSQPVAPETTETPVTPQANSGDLAQTGFSALTPLLIGLGLVGAGVGAVLLQRRRKSA